jgi:drug/metabolite transporter (DMT)-like permease
VRALSYGDASLVGLVDYARLPLALAVGFWLFAEQPDALTLMGAGIIIGSTLYITWREARVKSATPPAPESPS